VSATYTALKARVQQLLIRSSMAGQVQDFVAEAENFIVARLRVREMEKVAPSLTPADGAIAVPSDFLAPGELRLADKLEIELDYAPSKQLFRHDSAAFGVGNGDWNVIGDKIFIRPKPADTQGYWLKYIARPLALTETTQETNAVFPAYFDLYTDAVMWQAFEYLRNYEAADRRYQKALASIEQYNRNYRNEKHGSGALRMAPAMIV
jgi:hypothetical protein